MLSKEEDIKNRITSRFGEKIKTVDIKRVRRIFISVDRQDLIDIMSYLQSDLNMTHISTISGRDLGEDIEALFHMNDGGISLTVRVSAPKSDPHLPSVHHLFPGTYFYEKELESLFGFVLNGLPGGRRYPVSEDWPPDVHPLRKDWPPRPITEQDESGGDEE